MFSLYHKSAKKLSISSPQATLKVNNCSIDRVDTIKVLGVLLDDNLSQKKHIQYLEIKIAKSIGLMYKTKPFLDIESLLALYHSLCQLSLQQYLPDESEELNKNTLFE